MKRRKRWPIVVQAIFFTAVFGGSFWWFLIRGSSVISKYQPPPSIRICDYLTDRTDIRNIDLIDRDGIRYVRVILDPMPNPALPSGPPVYVFDNNGLITDWTTDIGDDPSFESRWKYAIIIKSLAHDCESIKMILNSASRPEVHESSN